MWIRNEKMAYCCDLPYGPKLYLDNQADQTIVMLLMQQSGQQQQSSNHFKTGVWQAPPIVMASSGGVMVKLTTATGEVLLQVQGMSIQAGVQSEMAANAGGTPIALVSIDAIPTTAGFTMTPMMPMSSMPPMQMGNMQMNMKPMAMQMGNMGLQMGVEVAPTNAVSSQASSSSSSSHATSPSASSASSHPKFCSQCGNGLKPGDRFCSSCGHSLQ